MDSWFSLNSSAWIEAQMSRIDWPSRGVAGRRVSGQAETDLWSEWPSSSISRSSLQWQVYVPLVFGIKDKSAMFDWLRLRRARLKDEVAEICRCFDIVGTPLCQALLPRRSGSKDVQSELRDIRVCHIDLGPGRIPERDEFEAIRRSFREVLSVMRLTDIDVQHLQEGIYDFVQICASGVKTPVSQWKSGPLLALQSTPSPQKILEKLAQPTLDHDERRRLMIDAEPVAFALDELGRLLPILREFVVRFRHSKDRDDMVAVGAALRKYAMNMPPKDLDRLHELFDPSPIAAIPCEIELELTKTLVWKLTERPPDTDDVAPDLGDRLFDLLETYLRPRLLVQKNFAAIALNAALGLLLLRSRHARTSLDRLRKLEVSWFTELVVRRARWLREDIENRFADDESRKYVRKFIELERQLEQTAA